MSYIYLPDPHPGRCKTYRMSNLGNQTRRCLDYEGISHVCTFEPDPPPNISGIAWSDGVFLPHPNPKPWVKPDTFGPDHPDYDEMGQ